MFFVQKIVVLSGCIKVIAVLPAIYNQSFIFRKNLFRKNNATLTREIITGTSTSGPITAVNASREFIPNTAIATAIASSKLLLAFNPGPEVFNNN
jgi:hypothetical protein